MMKEGVVVFFCSGSHTSAGPLDRSFLLGGGCQTVLAHPVVNVPLISQSVCFLAGCFWRSQSFSWHPVLWCVVNVATASDSAFLCLQNKDTCKNLKTGPLL